MKKISFLLLVIVFIFGATAQNRELKVSSFNVRNDNSGDADAGNGWQNRYPVIVSMILFHDLDIIGTQECKNNQVNDLKNHLPGYNYIGVGRGDGKTADEYSAIFYKTDKFDLLAHGDFWLSETPDVPSKGWDAALNRICTWGKFEEKATGFQFYAFNLHFDHVGVLARVESSKLVIDKIKEIAGESAPVFLTGDFNVGQTSEGYEIITSSCFLYDSYNLVPAAYRYALSGTFNDFKTNTVTETRIDHVFVTAAFTPSRYGVLTEIYWTDASGTPIHSGNFPAEVEYLTATPRVPSDHWPIVVALKY
ncbi:MAG: endonuclease/exonuclease/phosphatase family protein [Candidatus Symbiothrix sp.]|jgi:endonuclease/exonuclease/phosphatase family metal-dependent hydrolase|nr:endonuclease/exonuclease/phosphatase family protein [Candidatus Symbiothrix sp.]